MMDERARNEYLESCHQQLRELFSTDSGKRSDPAALHRVQGFIHAGKVLGVLTREQSQTMMEQVHLEVRGETLAERAQRKARLEAARRGEYECFDTPPSER
ncbi:hypothetical protein [Ferrimonas balearica]|nr:hypothetical protein [Ferrimonas balearica]